MIQAPFGQIRDILLADTQEVELRSIEHVKSTYLGAGTLLCKILTRYKMFLDPRDVGVASNIIMDGFWESWITKFIIEHVKPGDICIDAGANFGYYSLIMAELAGHQGKTLAIEPNKYLCNLLAKTSSVNGFSFDIENKALADHEGQMTLHIPENYWGSASLYKLKINNNNVSEISVEVDTLDNIVQKRGLQRVNFIKIDCEGAEPMIFKGMEKTLQQNPGIKIVMEYSPFVYSDARAFTEYLFSHFEVSSINHNSGLRRYTDTDQEHLISLTDHIDLFLEVKRSYKANIIEEQVEASAHSKSISP